MGIFPAGPRSATAATTHGSSSTTMSSLWPRHTSPRLSARTAAVTPPTLGSSVSTNCKIFKALNNEAFRPLELFGVVRKRFYRPRRNAAIKLIDIREIFVEKRFRSENAKIVQRASTKQHAIGPDKTIITHPHSLRRLSVSLDVHAVSEDLRMKS